MYFGKQLTHMQAHLYWTMCAVCAQCVHEILWARMRITPPLATGYAHGRNDKKDNGHKHAPAYSPQPISFCAWGGGHPWATMFHYPMLMPFGNMFLQLKTGTLWKNGQTRK